jgi:hypothetical protein
MRRQTMADHHLHLDEQVADVVACALLTALDDLEARAVLASHHDPRVGPPSAEEYRADARTLRRVLDELAPGLRAADPERVIVRWVEGDWAIVDGHPVPLVHSDVAASPRTTDADTTVLHTDRRDRSDRPPATVIELASRQTTVHSVASAAQDVSASATSNASPSVALSTRRPRHRLAPECEPAPDRVAERGADRC